MFIVSFVSNILLIIIIFYFIIIKKISLLYSQNLFLKAQLDALKKSNKIRIKTTVFQKILLALLYKFLKYPKHLCYIIKPETILKWYRNYIKKFWTFSFCKNPVGKPPITPETINLILKLKHENHTWGCRRISGELKKLNINVSKSKVAEILIKHGLDPTDYGLTWSKFLHNHISSLFAMDFKVITTLFGKTFYALFFISHFSRKIIHFNITQHPTKDWIKQQLRNFSFDFNEKVYLIRDNDALFQHIDFNNFNIKDIPISLQAPDMNAIAERFIGSFNREALNNFIIFNENQLRNIVSKYVYFYNNYRPHQGLNNIPISDYENNIINELKIISKSPKGEINKKQFLNGLLNHYYYKAS